MKHIKGRQTINKGDFLTVKNFCFPSCKKKIKPSSELKSESSELKSLRKSSSIAKVRKNDSLLLSYSNTQKRHRTDKLIRPVSANFFNTQFQRKKQGFRPFMRGRGMSRQPSSYSKLLTAKKEKKPAEKLKEVIGNRVDSAYRPSEDYTQRKTKIRVQAWIPTALVYDC